MKERIQKILSSEGIASRRQAENLIREGRIKVNGLEAILGMSISRHDLIEIDGKKIEISEGKKALRVLMYNKKIGEISTTKDSLDRPSVFQSLPKIINGKWISVGRLDINTSGLMLFTNDGKFANKLMHPSSNIEREYVARIRGKVETDHIRELLEGVNLEDGKASFSDIQPGRKGKTNQWFAMVSQGMGMPLVRTQEGGQKTQFSNKGSSKLTSRHVISMHIQVRETLFWSLRTKDLVKDKSI